jgi:DNA-binding XRE family transcriptional regulator
MEYKVGDRISIARKRADIKQEDLAKTIGVSTSTLQKIESGHTSPRLELVRDIADALAMDFQDLVL